jgi:hypothetical protein
MSPLLLLVSGRVTGEKEGGAPLGVIAAAAEQGASGPT